MGNVTIRCVKTQVEASDIAKFAAGQGKKVAVAGPTEVVRIKGGTPDKIEWDSGADQDWYVVIATEDNLVMP